MSIDVGKAIEDTLSRGRNGKSRKSLLLQKAWEKVAPESILEHTDNVVESNKKKDSIVVFVDDSACAASLSMNKEWYRQLMENETRFKIDDIFFLVSRSTGIRKKFQKIEERDPWYIDRCKSIPLTDKERDYIRRSLEGIKSEQLKETLFNTIVRDLEWKKGKKQANNP